MAKSRTKRIVRNLIVFSDTHFGCQFGLCPPEGVDLDGGGHYTPSKLQCDVWTWWEEFWNEWVPRVTRGEPFNVCLNGDAMDGRHHGSTTQISQNLADQQKLAVAVLKPWVVERCERFFLIRGTEAHSGPAGENEERLGKALGAVPDKIGNYARFELWIRVGGKGGPLCHILHHIGTTGSKHYESTAPQSEYVNELVEAAQKGVEPPDFSIRSHRHRYIKPQNPSEHHEAGCVVTPGWQLKTPFIFRTAGGRVSQPQFGGILIRQGDEEFYTRFWYKGLDRPEVEA